MIPNKLFFVEMMTNGIPVKKEIDVAAVLKIVEKDAEKHGCEITVLENELGVLAEDGSIAAALRLIEYAQNDWRLLFFLEDEEKILSSAKAVGSVLMFTITACAKLGFINYQKLPSLSGDRLSNSEEVEDFESDFI